MKAYEYTIKMRDRSTKTLSRIRKAAGLADSRLERLKNRARSVSASLKNIGRNANPLRGILIGTFSIGALMRFNSAVVQSTVEFSRYKAVLENTFQSAKAGEASFQMLSDFASKTPFQLNEVTGSFVKLVNRGIIPTQDQMRNIGDVAASQGKNFDQYVEAVLDAGTGEFERLKEFGIKAQSMGNKVALSFKGQTTKINKTEEAITDYLLKIGELDGVKGSMAAISQTLGGKLSNLQDKFSKFAFEAGSQLQPIYDFFLDKLGGAIDWLSSKDITPIVNKVLGFLQKAFSWTKMAYQQIKPFFEVFILGIQTIVNSPTLKWLAALAGLMLIINALNPVMLAVMGIVALIGILTYAYKKVGWFRGAMDAIVVGAKAVGKAIKEYFIARFKSFLQGLTGIGKALTHFFKGEWSQAWDAGKKGVSDLVGMDAKKKFVSDMKAMGKDATKSYHKGVAEAEANKNIKFKLFGDKKVGPSLDYDKDVVQKYGGAGSKSSGSSANKGVESVTGGGRRQTNINITIGKLNETIEVHTTNLKESPAQIEKMMQDLLYRVLNSANQMQTA